MSEEKKNKNYDIRIGKVVPSTESVERYKNFNSVLMDYKQVARDIHKKPLYKNPKMFMGLMLVLVIAYLVFEAVDEEDAMREKFVPLDGSILTPHVAEADLPYESIMVSADTARLYMTETGIAFDVPADAFKGMSVDEVDGEVELRYRVFRNPAHLMQAGINMNYPRPDSMDQMLESTGMIQVYAVQENEMLSIAKGKRIGIALRASGANTAGVKLFKVNLAEHRWELLDEEIEWKAAEDTLGDPENLDDVLDGVGEETGASFDTAMIDSIASGFPWWGATNDLYQAFYISEFGYYNCDRILESGDFTEARLKVELTEEVEAQEVFIMYAGLNTYFSLGFNFESVAKGYFDSKGSSQVLAIDKEGYLWRSKSINAKDLPGIEEVFEVKLEKVEGNLDSPEAFQQLLGLSAP